MPENTKEFFKLLFHKNHPPTSTSLDNEWERICKNYGNKNICMTFLNFPCTSSETNAWGDKDYTLVFKIMNFVEELNLHIANIVCRADDCDRIIKR